MPLAKDDHVRERMQRQGRRDTTPELALRRALHARRLRYQIDKSPLPGMRSRADVVFTRARVAVFVDGCFWHGCPEHGTTPANNREWWQEKLAANRARDVRVTNALLAAGWEVIRVWEHEDVDAVTDRVEAAVRQRLATAPG